MYNLLVSGDAEAWESNVYYMPIDRSIQGGEYTDKGLAEKFGRFDDESCRLLLNYPCLFAYESNHNKDPKFGWLREITKQREQIRMEYQMVDLIPWISCNDLLQLSNNLDIGGWELSRTHWSLKNVDLSKELKIHAVTIPALNETSIPIISIDEHLFQAALSFPGEARAYVRQVADELNLILPKNSFFYDDFFTAQLARPSLDILLQKIYGKHSALLVVFLSGDYDKKDWCGIEFRAIREIITRKEHNRIMYIRTDDKPVEGVLTIDGYVDARKFSPAQLATFIRERIQLLS